MRDSLRGNTAMILLLTALALVTEPSSAVGARRPGL